MNVDGNGFNLDFMIAGRPFPYCMICKCRVELGVDVRRVSLTHETCDLSNIVIFRHGQQRLPGVILSPSTWSHPTDDAEEAESLMLGYTGRI